MKNAPTSVARDVLGFLLVTNQTRSDSLGLLKQLLIHMNLAYSTWITIGMGNPENLVMFKKASREAKQGGEAGSQGDNK